MCEIDKYLSDCCGATHDTMWTYENGEGICSKCKEHATFWDEDDNKEYEDGNYYFEYGSSLIRIMDNEKVIKKLKEDIKNDK